MKPNTTRRRFIQASGLAVATTGVSMPVSAQTTDSTQGILADGITYEPDYGAFASGLFSGRVWRPKDLEQTVDDARNEFRANSDRWVSYGNWLLEEADVSPYGNAEIGVTFKHDYFLKSEETTETTVVADYDDATDRFTDLDWLLESPEDPDFEVTLTNNTAENASDELSEFRRKFIDDDGDDHELPSNEYLNTIAGKYAFAIGVGEDASNVLELLLGWSP
ncbi:twin-arginine translocation signal domain-containing protein [Natronosalvus rutilus]|uniref:Twin-arginine translocation signal domain-containing protein n=1 Tax=Natronosalvus rutilus TaxID=2953753 RepID=A0A9E7N6S8_9EURY|nr:twin-arginine translocation signal domain-containing protein [Natronosalvus rutilus]UTF52754.1 twin-arginine translocation signal domain-containing protein [Natronosalvus rutilus]